VERIESKTKKDRGEKKERKRFGKKEREEEKELWSPLFPILLMKLSHIMFLGTGD
jgi:hypothetical protein